MAAAADADDGAKQQRYHKSKLRFFGLKAAQQKAIFREVFPPRERIEREEALRLVDALWDSRWFDELVMAVMLLEKTASQLAAADLDRLHRMTRQCEGWALLDFLATRVLGPLAMRKGESVYDRVRGWSDDPWLWTRRAAILVHVAPARRARLHEATCWPTFEDRLHEREFFIRKAVGWALRECSKHYPQEVYRFLRRVGDRASGLTRREGMRRLPVELREHLE